MLSALRKRAAAAATPGGIAVLVMLAAPAMAQSPDSPPPITSRDAAGPSLPPQTDAPEPAQSWLPQTGADLLRLSETCEQNPPETPPEMRNCYGFQAGVVVSALYFSGQAEVAPPFCVPDGTTDADLARAVARFVSGNEAARSYPAIGVVVAAMVTRFPCDTANPQDPK